MFNHVPKKSHFYQQSLKVVRMVQDIIRNKVKKKTKIDSDKNGSAKHGS